MHELFFGQPLEHEAAHGNVDMGFGVIDSAFIVSGEAAGLVKPAEGALDDPTLAYELETLGGVASRDDIQAEFAKGTQTWAQLGRVFDLPQHAPSAASDG